MFCVVVVKSARIGTNVASKQERASYDATRFVRMNRTSPHICVRSITNGIGRFPERTEDCPNRPTLNDAFPPQIGSNRQIPIRPNKSMRAFSTESKRVEAVRIPIPPIRPNSFRPFRFSPIRANLFLSIRPDASANVRIDSDHAARIGFCYSFRFGGK